MLLAYKYRIYPTEEDKILLAKHFGCCRFLYNHFLTYRKEEYQKGNKVSYYITQKELTKMKALDEYSWLNEVASQSLQMSIQQLDDAYKKFFRQQGGYPNYKSKHNSTQSCSFPQNVRLDENRVYLPKFIKNGIKINIHRELPENASIKQATITKKNNKYYISISFDDNLPTPKPIIAQSSIGLDVGINSLVATSKDVKIANPRYTKKYARILKLASRHLSRKQHSRKKGDTTPKSKRYLKQQAKVARIHEKIANSRSDYIHKITNEITNQYDVICIEDLNVKGMIRNHKLSKYIADVAWGELRRQLEYKSERKGKILIKVDRWLPSSQTCSSCLSLTGKKPLNVRTFTCPICGTIHDRDNNAAKVIEHYGLLEFYKLGLQHNLSAGTVDYTRGEPSDGDGDSISIVAPSSHGSVKREALASLK
jgi:transposase, IS605 orfB family